MKRKLVPPLLAAWLLLACQAVIVAPSREPQASHFPGAEYRRLETGDGVVFWRDPRASAVHIHVYRGGPLAARGHNHVIVATDFVGAAFIPAWNLAQARFDLEIPVDRLEVDPPALRARLGGGFASAVDAEARAGTRANMLSAAVLDAGRHPYIAVRSRELAGEIPKLALNFTVSMRGVSRAQWVPVDVRIDGDRLLVRGTLVLDQRDFGIRPFSALGGLLRVQELVVVEFRLVGWSRQQR